MRLRYFGGPAWEASDLPVRGRGQQALLLRLAIDTGTLVSYRALAEDIWPDDAPADPRAALQSLVSRVRKALPGLIDAAPGGYRLTLDRAEIDLTAFQDLVAAARASGEAQHAHDALALWTGDPWTPEGFDWLRRDLLEDKAHALRLTTSTPAPPASTNATVPAALTTLVGRAVELDTIASQLSESRLVTVLGPGGAGKTTLALETARRARGSIVVELAPATPSEVWNAIAGAVGRTVRITESLERLDPRSRAMAELAGRDIILVMDNCEHLSAEAADAAVTLLQAVPTLSILATSREPLGVVGEAFVPLAPLPEADALELFARRVRAASGSSLLESADIATATRIVRRLDGLPLALELAAAKTRTLTLAEIEAGLDDRFALLASGPRTADPRHRTLRALIDWSWEMLSPPERTALLGAAALPDGVLAADIAVVARHLGTNVAAFDHLVERSLLQRASGRLRTLETVREYGLDALRTSGDEQRVRLTVAAATAELALRADAVLRGPRGREAIGWFDANDENLASALRDAENAHDPSLGLHLVRGVFWAWAMRERFPDLTHAIQTFVDDDTPLDSEAAVVVCGVATLVAAFEIAPTLLESDPVVVEAIRTRCAELTEASRRYPSELSLALPPLLRAVVRALDAPDPRRSLMWGMRLDDIDEPGTPDWTRAVLGILRTAFAQNSGEIDALGEGSATALQSFRRLGDAWGISLASHLRAEWLVLFGRLEEALEVADSAEDLLIGLTTGADIVQQRMAGIEVLSRMGRFDEAHRRLVDIEAQARADGSDAAVALFHFMATVVALAENDADAALAHLNAPASRARVADTGENQLRSWSHCRSAQAYLLKGDQESAAAALRRALTAAHDTTDQPIIAGAVLTLAWWLAAAGQTEQARRAFGLAVQIRGRSDTTDPAFQRVITLVGEPPKLSPSDDTLERQLEELIALLG